MMGYLIGLIPSARGLFAILIAGVVGELVFGRVGALVPVALVIVAFIRPKVSMWLESILFATRFFGLAGGLFQFFVTPIATGQIRNPVLGVTMFVLGLAAFFRIRSLLKSGDICPVGAGTAG